MPNAAVAMSSRYSKRSRGAATRAALALGLAALALDERALAQPGGMSPCDVRTSERVVAVGDVHGAYAQFAAILRAAALIDGRDRWIGGRAILVQTGDVLDRGSDSRRALDLLRRLEREAAQAGGRVFALLGNHEVMRMLDDWRYVSAGEYAAFQTGSSEEIRERAFGVVAAEASREAKAAGRPHEEAAFRAQFFHEVPLGSIEMQQAFGTDGEYGRWLRNHHVLVKINDVLYLHGGVSPSAASLRCDQMNDTVRLELAASRAAVRDPASLLVTSEVGPLWYRGLTQEPEEAFLPAVMSILSGLEARAAVIGHTVAPNGRIAARFGGRVLQVDTGMLGGSFFPGGRASALEIRGGEFTAIYADEPRRPATLALTVLGPR